MLKETPYYVTKEKRDLADFKAIIADLRSEDGCPWDKKQTHASMKEGLLDEAAEAVSAISLLEKTGNYENLREELGDVLLQVVMQSQIAEEEGFFTLEDVIEEVSSKMIRRHPHVYGDVMSECQKEESFTVEGTLKKWNEIKAVEKENHSWEESPRKKKFCKRVVKWFVKRL